MQSRNDNHAWHRRACRSTPAARRIPRVLAGALLAITATPCAAQLTEDEVYEQNLRCLECHGRPHIAELSPQERLSMVGTWLGGERPADDMPPESAPAPLRGDEPERRPGLYVTVDTLDASVHVGLACTSCHEDAARLPHGRRLNRLTCASECHQDATDMYAAGTHATAEEARNGVARPGCSTCHGGHDIGPVESKTAPTHPLNMVVLCADCHGHQTGTTPAGYAAAEQATRYVDSIHGRAVTEGGLVSAATCASCHENHRVLPASDAQSAVHRDNIPKTCGQCHQKIGDLYAESIHGRLFAEGDERAPACTDCHSAHGISRTDSPAFMHDIVSECGDCHEDQGPRQGFRSTFYETYRASYHGQVTRLGSTRAARCSDCHGSHDILPASDPSSSLHATNLVETCRSCHPRANDRFVMYDPHADYRDRARYPLLFGIWIYFIIVMSGAFGFFGLHTVLWFMRSIVERIRHGPAPHPGAGTCAIHRFSLLHRINHALAAISFFGLTATGIPLVFSDRPWAQPLVDVVGGVTAAGIWHRAFACVLFVNAVIFIVGIAMSIRHRRGSIGEWLFGPESLMPRIRDLRDCAGMFRWFFRGGAKPAFDRWTYWEKFDFWCEIAGTLIIGGSGLLLWFPGLAAKLFPGWFFNAAMVVHGYEALLAICFIFTIHFFNANLRPDKFPVDDVIFTGRVDEEEFEHERSLEYERLRREGQLSVLRVPPAPRRQRVVATILGIILMAFGLLLITLIILAGLDLLWETPWLGGDLVASE